MAASCATAASGEIQIDLPSAGDYFIVVDTPATGDFVLEVSSVEPPVAAPTPSPCRTRAVEGSTVNEPIICSSLSGQCELGAAAPMLSTS